MEVASGMTLHLANSILQSLKNYNISTRLICRKSSAFKLSSSTMEVIASMQPHPIPYFSANKSINSSVWAMNWVASSFQLG